MGWEGIGDLIGTIAKWWAPEKVRERARTKLSRLKEEEREILKKPADNKTGARLLIIRRDIGRLQTYLANG